MDLQHARILILRLSSIGDVLHATPVAHNLKIYYPGCYVAWLVSPPASELLIANPDIDELLVWDRRPVDRALNQCRLCRVKKSLDALGKFLAEKKFDIVLDIQCLFLTGIIAKMSGAGKRIGIHDRHEFNHLFMTQRGPKIRDTHKIRHYMTALIPLGIQPIAHTMVLRLPRALDDFAQAFWRRWGICQDLPLLLVNIRTTWPSKNWPPALFAEALNSLPETIQIVFCGAAEDRPYVDEARASLRRSSSSIVGETGLLELAALMRSASLLLTGDTGPLYIAVASGLPTLSLWGPTHPSVYGPLDAEKHAFVLSPHSCTNCNKVRCRKGTNDCMDAISSETVGEALRNFFQC